MNTTLLDKSRLKQLNMTTILKLKEISKLPVLLEM